MRFLAIVAVVLIAATGPAEVAFAGEYPTAPEFTKTALSGGTVSLSDFQGEIVVLFLLGYG